MLTKSVLFSTRMWTCTLHRSTLIFFSSIKIVWILQWSGIVFYSQFSNWGLVLIKILDSVSVSVLFSVFYHPNSKNMIVLHGGGIDHHVDHSSNQFISWQQHWAMWEWREKVRSCQSHLFSGPAMYERRHRVLFCLLLNILTALSQDQAFPSPCGDVVMSSLSDVALWSRLQTYTLWSCSLLAIIIHKRRQHFNISVPSPYMAPFIEKGNKCPKWGALGIREGFKNSCSVS